MHSSPNPYAAELRELSAACQHALTMRDVGRVLVYTEVGFNVSTERALTTASRLIEDEGLLSERPEGVAFGDQGLVDSAERVSERHFDRFVGRQTLDLGWTELPDEITASTVPMVDRSVSLGLTDKKDGGYVGISELYLNRVAEPDSTQYSVGVNTASEGYFHGNFTVWGDGHIKDVAFIHLRPAAEACYNECVELFGDDPEMAKLLEGHFLTHELDEQLRQSRDSVEGIYPAELTDDLLARVRQEALAAKHANGEHGGVTPERLARITQFVLSIHV